MSPWCYTLPLAYDLVKAPVGKGKVSLSPDPLLTLLFTEA